MCCDFKMQEVHLKLFYYMTFIVDKFLIFMPHVICVCCVDRNELSFTSHDEIKDFLFSCFPFDKNGWHTVTVTRTKRNSLKRVTKYYITNRTGTFKSLELKSYFWAIIIIFPIDALSPLNFDLTLKKPTVSLLSLCIWHTDVLIYFHRACASFTLHYSSLSSDIVLCGMVGLLIQRTPFV